MSNLRVSSNRTTSSPPSSPLYRSSTVEKRDSQRLNSVPGNRTSVLLSERQFNRISQNLANIRHNSISGSTESLIPSKYPSFMNDMAVATEPIQSSKHQSYPTTPSMMPRSISSGELWNSQNINNLPTQDQSQLQSDTDMDNENHPSVGVFPDYIQEYAMIEDLLYVFMGINGTYIKFDYPSIINDSDDDPMDDLKSIESTTTWDTIKYDVDSTLDPSLRHMVEKLLPLATYYMSIDSFVEQFSRFEYGTVNHALCSAIRVFLKEYLNFIAQLEHQFQTSNQFTLHRLWFFAQDTLQQMRVLHQLTNIIRGLGKKVLNDDEDDIDAVLEGLKSAESSDDIQIPDKQKGAAILNILSDRLIGLSGDPKCKQIYTFLLSRASTPYFDILHSWIYRGEIKDPYNEFMVLEKQNVKKENLKEDFNDAYWEMRYTIRQGGLVPVFLEPLKQQILLAGKFLNVVRECGVNIAKPDEMLDTLSQNIFTIEQQLQQNQRSSRIFANNENNNNDSQAYVYRRNSPLNNSNLSQVATRNDVWAAVEGGVFIKNLEIAYKYANRTLLHLLLNEQQLTARLRSLKHYFFLDQADFLTSFLDLAKDELRKPAQEIPLTRLQSLLDIVLRNSSSVAAYDPFKEEVVVAMSPLKLIDQLLRIINVSGMETSQLPLGSPLEMSTSSYLQDGQKSLSSSIYLLERSQSLSGSMILNSNSSSNKGSSSTNKEVLNGYDAFTLDYKVTFPLSLVISRKALTKYQLLFRHLLYLKHVEDLLCKTWMDQKGMLWKKLSGSPQIEKWKFRIFTLRNQMLAFVQQFTYYVTNEVLEPNWRQLETNLTKVSTVDEVLQYHSDFLDTCLKECMLTNSKLLRIYNKLMSSCMKFTSYTEKFSQILQSLEDQRSGLFGMPKLGTDSISNNTNFETIQKSVSKIEEAFGYHMKLLIDALNYFSATETVQFLCLVARLDYNSFFCTSK